METTNKADAAPATYTFGALRFEVRERTLRGTDRPVRLTPKSADLLLALVRSAGRVVSKRELIRQVWPETFVSDTNLTFQINQLRKALRDPAESPRYIETVPSAGYKFICQIVVDGDSGAPTPPCDELISPALVRR